MKKTLPFILILFTLLSACRKDATIHPKSFPFLVTKAVTDIDSTGATFHAEILTEGNEGINYYGFIWRIGNHNFYCSTENTGSLRQFSSRISSDLELNKNYSCRAFVRLIADTVFGDFVTFTSLGCASPQLDNINPKEGFDGTVVTLTGTGFSHDTQNNEVFINNVPAAVVASTGNSITFKTPRMSFFGDAPIALKVGSHLVSSTLTFKILGPEIESYSSLSGYSGGYLTLNGKNFTQNGLNLDVYFDSFKVTIIDYSETTIKVLIPFFSDNLLTDKSVAVKIVNGLKTAVCEDYFMIKKSWEPRQATPFTGGWPFQAVTYNEKGYIFEPNSSTLYEYDPVLNTWNSMPSSLFPGQKIYSSLIVRHGNKLIKAGGYNALQQPLNELWIFSFADNTWVKKNDIPFNFDKSVAFEQNNQIFVITSGARVWRCDFENEQYVQLNDFPVSFSGSYEFATSFVADGKVYVVTAGKTWQYNDQNDSWLAKSANYFSQNHSDTETKAFTLKNTGYILQEGDELFKYYVENDKWLRVSEFPGCPYNVYQAIFTIGTKTYVAATGSFYTGCAPLMYSYQD
ncbi:MAG: IPT/TIG domain-containing protein [Bacteroidetes bacterium]|nr:IPT/TIG domain-containing protein [Bacteroidota bacterium]